MMVGDRAGHPAHDPISMALKPGAIELDKRHAILTLADQFLPHAGLKKRPKNHASNLGPIDA